MDFADTLKDARLLIEHAARSGVQVSAADTAAIADFERALDSGQATTQAEVAFWSGLSNIAKVIQPVTVESLKASYSSDGGGATSRKRYNAASAVFRYRRWALGTLVILVLIQIYSLVGNTLINDIADHEKRLKALGRNHLLEAQSGVNPDVVEQQLEIATLSNTVDTSYEVLIFWNHGWRLPLAPLRPLIRPFVGEANASGSAIDSARGGPVDDSVDPSLAREVAFRKARVLAGVEARFALSSLSLYILPALYGLLGTCVYILRNLASEIKATAFASDVAYQLRLPLGALAGVAIAFVPDSVAARPGDPVTQLALAFVAGYSVEVLFAVMDRFISSFTGTPPGAAPR
jgi:hypothetical protein